MDSILYARPIIHSKYINYKDGWNSCLTPQVSLDSNYCGALQILLLLWQTKLVHIGFCVISDRWSHFHSTDGFPHSWPLYHPAFFSFYIFLFGHFHSLLGKTMTSLSTTPKENVRKFTLSNRLIGFKRNDVIFSRKILDLFSKGHERKIIKVWKWSRTRMVFGGDDLSFGWTSKNASGLTKKLTKLLFDNLKTDFNENFVKGWTYPQKRGGTYRKIFWSLHVCSSQLLIKC